VETHGIGGRFASVRVGCESVLLVTSPGRHYIALWCLVEGHPYQHLNKEAMTRRGAMNPDGHGRSGGGHSYLGQRLGVIWANPNSS
jgi:hypothetical protein